MVQPILDQLQAGGVYIADRNFCDGPLIPRFLDAEAYFLLRQHGRSPRWRKVAEETLVEVGVDCKGGRVDERVIEVYLPEDDRWERVRQITIRLAEPTRDGDLEIRLVTNLPNTVSALQLSNAYLRRWTIETSLGYVATALRAEINTLAYPKAALLCFCLGLVLFNLIRTIEKLLLQYHSPDAAANENSSAQESTAHESTAAKSSATWSLPALCLSHYYLAAEIAEVSRGMEIALRGPFWLRFSEMSTEEFLVCVGRIAAQADLSVYEKSHRGAKLPPPKRKTGKGMAHFSTHRLVTTGKC